MKLLDSNIIIAEAARTEQEEDPLFLDEGFCFSIITRIEVLGFFRITAREEEKIIGLLGAGEQLALTPGIARAAIHLRQARRMSLGDSIIAATALEHGLPLVTRNWQDFRHIAELEIVSA